MPPKMGEGENQNKADGVGRNDQPGKQADVSKEQRKVIEELLAKDTVDTELLKRQKEIEETRAKEFIEQQKVIREKWDYIKAREKALQDAVRLGLKTADEANKLRKDLEKQREGVRGEWSDLKDEQAAPKEQQGFGARAKGAWGKVSKVASDISRQGLLKTVWSGMRANREAEKASNALIDKEVEGFKAPVDKGARGEPSDSGGGVVKREGLKAAATAFGSKNATEGVVEDLGSLPAIQKDIRRIREFYDEETEAKKREQKDKGKGEDKKKKEEEDGEGGGLFSGLGKKLKGFAGKMGGMKGMLSKGVGIAGGIYAATQFIGDYKAAEKNWGADATGTGKTDTANMAAQTIAGDRDKDAMKRAGKNALKFAGLGAAVGTFAGPLGTVVGGAIGGLVGGVIGLIGQENISNAIKTVFGKTTEDVKSEINYWDKLSKDPAEMKRLGYTPEDVQKKLAKYRTEMGQLIVRGGQTGFADNMFIRKRTELARGVTALEELQKMSDDEIMNRTGWTREVLEKKIKEQKEKLVKEMGGKKYVKSMDVFLDATSDDIDKTLRATTALTEMIANPQKYGLSPEEVKKAQEQLVLATEQHRKNMEAKLQDTLTEDSGKDWDATADLIEAQLKDTDLGFIEKLAAKQVVSSATVAFDRLKNMRNMTEEELKKQGIGSKEELEKRIAQAEIKMKEAREKYKLDQGIDQQFAGDQKKLMEAKAVREYQKKYGVQVGSMADVKAAEEARLLKEANAQATGGKQFQSFAELKASSAGQQFIAKNQAQLNVSTKAGAPPVAVDALGGMQGINDTLKQATAPDKKLAKQVDQKKDEFMKNFGAIDEVMRKFAGLGTGGDDVQKGKGPDQAPPNPQQEAMNTVTNMFPFLANYFPGGANTKTAEGK